MNYLKGSFLFSFLTITVTIYYFYALDRINVNYTSLFRLYILSNFNFSSSNGISKEAYQNRTSKIPYNYTYTN